MVLPKVHYYWQITDGRRDRTNRLQLLDVTTSTRNYTSATSVTGPPSNVATEPPDATLLLPRRRTSAVSVEHDIEHKNVYIISRGGS